MTAVLRPSLLAAVGLALLGVVCLWLTSDFPWGVPASSDPALLPRVAAIGLIGVGLVVAAFDVVGQRRRSAGSSGDATGSVVPDEMVPEELRSEHEDAGTAPRTTALLVLLVVLWSQAAFRLGFLVSTAAFLFLGSLLLGRERGPRSLAVAAVFAVAVAAATSYGFFDLLGVRRPSTPLP